MRAEKSRREQVVKNTQKQLCRVSAPSLVMVHTRGTVIASGVDQGAQVNEGGAILDGAGHLGRAMSQRERQRDRETERDRERETQRGRLKERERESLKKSLKK